MGAEETRQQHVEKPQRAEAPAAGHREKYEGRGGITPEGPGAKCRHAQHQRPREALLRERRQRIDREHPENIRRPSERIFHRPHRIQPQKQPRAERYRERPEPRAEGERPRAQPLRPLPRHAPQQHVREDEGAGIADQRYDAPILKGQPLRPEGRGGQRGGI